MTKTRHIALAPIHFSSFAGVETFHLDRRWIESIAYRIGIKSHQALDESPSGLFKISYHFRSEAGRESFALSAHEESCWAFLPVPCRLWVSPFRTPKLSIANRCLLPTSTTTAGGPPTYCKSIVVPEDIFRVVAALITFCLSVLSKSSGKSKRAGWDILDDIGWKIAKMIEILRVVWFV